jgi:hypothetical protein
VTAGDAVWLGLGVLTAAWVVATVVAGPRRLPGIGRAGRWLVGAWAPRLVSLAAWSLAGWHLFCQRP